MTRGAKRTFVTWRLTGDDDAPLAGWHVGCTPNEADLGSRAAVTDARGEFAFAARGEFTHRLVVREPGHGAPLPLEGLDAVRAGGEPLHVRISPLQRNTCWIEGQLFDSENRPAIAGQHLALRYGGTWLRPGRTFGAAVVDAATGDFRVGPLPPGPATVVFAGQDTVEFAVECVLHPQRTTPLGRLVLPVGGRLQVQLALADGVELDQITVQLDRGESSDLVRVDRQTLSAAKLLRAGRYRARVFGRGFRTLERAIEIQDGAATELTGTLRPAVRFGLRVMKPTGERTARFVVRDSQGQEVLDTDLDAATSSEDWWPFLDRGVYRAEAIGASGRVYVAEFTVVDLAPRSTPLEVKVAPR